MLSSLLLAILGNQGDQLSDYVTGELASHYTFTITEAETKTRLRFRRSPDGARLTLLVNDFRDTGRILDERHDKPSSAEFRWNWTPSGYWMGQYSRFSLAGVQSSVVSYAGGMNESAQCSIALNADRARLEPARMISVEQEQVKLEAFTRDALGGYAARRLTPDGNVLLGGASYPAFKAAVTNARLIELETWLSRNNLTATASHDGTVLNFTKGGTPWIVPLGSVKIKKGEDWITMPDLVMRRSGKYLIPVSALN